MKARFIALILLFIVALALPTFANTFVLNVLSLSFALGILATSINLVGGYSGTIPLGQAGIMACSGYAMGVAATRMELGFVEQMLFGIAVAIVISAIFGVMVMRTSGIQFLMITLAQGMMIWGLSLRMYPVTGGENGLHGIERPPMFDTDTAYFYFALLALVLTLSISALVIRSPFGLALRALKDSESRLNMLGYNPSFIKFFSFVIAGALAGIAGVVFAYYNRFISPESAGFLMSGKAVLMVILGGSGTLLGPVLGAVIIVFIENFLSGYTRRWPSVMGLLFIISVLFARNGIVGGAERLIERGIQFVSLRSGGARTTKTEFLDEQASDA